MSNYDSLVLSTVRTLAADLVQQYKGGHPGTAMGAAPIGLSLWRDILQYNPTDPLYPNRDRFVLSAGHACLLQYIFLHFAGYKAWPLDELKKYHAPSPGFKTSRAAGHPEIEHGAGIEVTTGPLGQGLANAVGLAVAGRGVKATYFEGKEQEFERLADGTVWCFTGDGCLQEGVGQEAISVAGHLALDNLVLIYDQNKITVDGNIDECFTEDVALRFKAAKWHVLHVAPPSEFSNDTDHINEITRTLNEARAHKGQPVLVIIPTTIGFGSKKQGTAPTHGAALGEDDVRHVKAQLKFNPDEKFVVPSEVYSVFSHVSDRGQALQKSWTDLLAKYREKYPEDYADFARRLKGDLPSDWQSKLPKKEDLPQAAQPTRKSSGVVVKALVPHIKDFMVGSADLLESTFVSWDGMVEFQDPRTNRGNYAGRQIRYGIREFSMAAIANGMTAWFSQHPYDPFHLEHKGVNGHSKEGHQKRNGGGFIPVYSTFFMFMSYALPAIRMAALQGLRTIAIATHDSIGIGEDGPTHQPIALAQFFRALPNCRLWRPADAEEVVAAWEDALLFDGENRAGGGEAGHGWKGAGPSVICLSRQAVPLLEGTSREKARTRGAYTVWGCEGEDVKLALVATGSEVSRAISVATKLASSESQLPEWIRTKIRVVSAPNLDIFNAQPSEYRLSTIPSDRALVVSLEAYRTFGWERYAHAGFGMTGFGWSAPGVGGASVFEFFGFGVDNIVSRVGGWVNSRVKGEVVKVPVVGEWEELLGDWVPQ
ncbi:hypothetical protein V5O48_010479 [Marasmius crinis-equi]|uniref:Transketolase-like pyrimidine-binding domain-containing protein n=1 Tax=Marasmius crinis-equi TaxID=585013 RepID=A0ABR3F891_9AGAR